MPEIIATITSALAEIETRDGVRILFAVESGSRAWGFASPDSDYDVRFVYVRPLQDYVRLRPRRDVIERPIDTSLENPLDFSGWDIVKALNLFRSSNPPLLEWLHSPVVYLESGPLVPALRELAAQYYSPLRMTYHYLSMGKRTYKEYLEGRSEVSLKKYLYALRPLLSVRWLEECHSPPPTLFATTLNGITLANDVREKLSELLERKNQAGEQKAEPPDATLIGFIETEIERISRTVKTMPDREMLEEPLNALLWELIGVRTPESRKDDTNHGK